MVPAAAVLLIALAALALAPRMDSGVVGRAQAAAYIDMTGIDTPAGVGAVDGRTEALIGAIMADLTRFWSEELPPITRTPFTPLRGSIVAVDSSAVSGSAPCVAAPADIVGNAYYCPSDDGIVYDATTLIPVLLHRSGIGGLITTFAHEYGHAVQERIAAAEPGRSTEPTPTALVTEARADCDAGAFLAWASAGHAPRLHVDSGILISAIGPLVDFSDPATVQPDDPTAHGLAVDRLTWFLTGFRGGAGACVHLGEPLQTTLGRTGGQPNASPRYATPSLLLAAAERSIEAFDGHRSDTSPSSAQMNVTAPHGQFAQATALALATAAAAGDDAAGAACFAGSWVRALVGHASPGELGGWPGDADEGLAAVLLQPGADFADVTGYIDGFRSGTC